MNAIEKIKSFAELPEGWDGYDGKPITKLAVKKAIELYELLQDKPNRITPSVVNAVAFSWTEYKLFLEVYKDGEVCIVERYGTDGFYIKTFTDYNLLSEYIHKYISSRWYNS